jgi:hypothetical protein
LGKINVAVINPHKNDLSVRRSKEWFKQEVTDLRDYQTDNPGVGHTLPA